MRSFCRNASDSSYEAKDSVSSKERGFKERRILRSFAYHRVLRFLVNGFARKRSCCVVGKGLCLLSRRNRNTTLGGLTLIIGISVTMMSAPVVAAAPRSAGGQPQSQTTDGLAYGQQTRFGKSHNAQDPKWYAAKMARRDSLLHIGSGSNGVTPYAIVGLPTAYYLDTSVSGQTYEPFGTNGTDVNGHPYTDTYFWNFCGEGATTVALGSWNTLVPINGKGTYTYSDSQATTTWNNTNNRSYLTWLGAAVRPPSFSSPGEFAYSADTTYATDLRDTLNWEASRENSSTWNGIYYGIVSASNLSQGNLMSDIESDVGIDHHADVVDVNTKYMPGWSNYTAIGKSASHYLAITGYDSASNTLQYVETCGLSCGSNGQGTYNVSLSTLYTAIENNNGNGSLVW